MMRRLALAAKHAGLAYALAIARQSPDVARDNYAAFPLQAGKLPKAALAAFLPAALVPLLLQSTRRAAVAAPDRAVARRLVRLSQDRLAIRR